MRYSHVGEVRPDTDAAERRRVWRDATAMMLYVSIVLLAELAALPAGDDDGGTVHGPVGWELVAILWGTSIGLAVAHWFAFVLATQGLSRGPLRGWDRVEALSELAGVAVVAAVASVPVLLLREDTEQEVVRLVLALMIGAVAYVVERASGRTRAASVLFGLVALAIALALATVKHLLSGH